MLAPASARALLDAAPLSSCGGWCALRSGRGSLVPRATHTATAARTTHQPAPPPGAAWKRAGQRGGRLRCPTLRYVREHAPASRRGSARSASALGVLQRASATHPDAHGFGQPSDSFCRSSQPVPQRRASVRSSAKSALAHAGAVAKHVIMCACVAPCTAAPAAPRAEVVRRRRTVPCVPCRAACRRGPAAVHP
jgi:hypothetical protein